VLVVRRARRRSPSLEWWNVKAIVRSCQSASEVALSVSKPVHRVDTGLTREVINEHANLGTRRRHCSVYGGAFRNGDGRATNAARHTGIGVPPHHKRTVTLRPRRMSIVEADCGLATV
jgi:hypothetical protein